MFFFKYCLLYLFSISFFLPLVFFLLLFEKVTYTYHDVKDTGYMKRKQQLDSKKRHIQFVVGLAVTNPLDTLLPILHLIQKYAVSNVKSMFVLLFICVQHTYSKKMLAMYYLTKLPVINVTSKARPLMRLSRIPVGITIYSLKQNSRESIHSHIKFLSQDSILEYVAYFYTNNLIIYINHKNINSTLLNYFTLK